MKVSFTLLICLYSFISSSQLDTNKLALFGKEHLSADLIFKADSLLIQAVDYYNSKVQRTYSLIGLSDSMFVEYLGLDSLRNEIKPYFTKKGKVKAREIKKLNQEDKQRIQNLIEKKDSINDRILFLKKIGESYKEDSIVTIWGSAEYIDLKNYNRQYQYWFDEKDNCHIRVSCFCSYIIETLNKTPVEYRINWKLTPLKVNDGGVCFFTILIDLNANKAYNMRVNGGF